MTPRLFIIGDSFAQPLKATQSADTWLEIVRQELGQHHRCDIEVINKSFYGVSQDFGWFFLQLWAQDNEITARDYVIVVLTHPNRYWYFEDKPDLGNGAFIIGIEDHITESQTRAVQGYVTEIQRPTLDSIQMVSRLGWLSNSVREHGWPRPLVIKAFEFDTYATTNYATLNWAQGFLTNIQREEFGEDADVNSTTSYFSGIDCRYNHMCLRNHKILGQRTAQALITDSTLDLTEGYHKNIMPLTALSDPEFAQQEWCQEQVDLYKQRMQEMKLRKFKLWTK